MTTTMTITLLIITAVSIALNVFQFMERRVERMETKRLIEEKAVNEVELEDIKSKYQNEIHHKEWAIGRIKDQQAIIDQLKHNIMPNRVYKPRKEANNVR